MGVRDGKIDYLSSGGMSFRRMADKATLSGGYKSLTEARFPAMMGF